LQDSSAADLDDIAARIVDAMAREETTSPPAAAFLLRHYTATGRDDLREPLGLALAYALALADDEAGAYGRAGWLTLFADAAAVADDDRVVAAARGLTTALRGEWPSADALRDGVASVDACLHASAIADAAGIVPPAIEELERIVGAAYRPGGGLFDAAAGRQASLGDHARAASALLTAFEITGRLPYSMLAEELMQTSRHLPARGDDVAAQCAAARALCRLAALHGDAGYRAAATIASGADYRADAARILAAQAPRARSGSADDAALYGVAQHDLLSLR
jgi:hypothetical protein